MKNDRLPVLEVVEVPSIIKLDVAVTVTRETRAYFYRRGSYDCPVAVEKVTRMHGCDWFVPTPKNMPQWEPGRYEVQIKTSAVDIAAAYEIKLGKQLRIKAATVEANCGEDCCV